MMLEPPFCSNNSPGYSVDRMRFSVGKLRAYFGSRRCCCFYKIFNIYDPNFSSVVQRCINIDDLLLTWLDFT